MEKNVPSSALRFILVETVLKIQQTFSITDKKLGDGNRTVHYRWAGKNGWSCHVCSVNTSK